jgi:hypothetical protein
VHPIVEVAPESALEIEPAPVTATVLITTKSSEDRTAYASGRQLQTHRFRLDDLVADVYNQSVLEQTGY